MTDLGGALSKNDPPPRDGDVTFGAAGVAFCVILAGLLRLSRPEKDDGFGGGGDDDLLEKFMPPKASESPPKASLRIGREDSTGGDPTSGGDIPPKEGWRA